MSKLSYTGEEEANFVEEDPRSEVIKELTDPNEIKAAQELLEDKYEVSPKDTTSGTTGTATDEESSEEKTDTPDSSEETTATSKEDVTDNPNGEDTEQDGDNDFVLSDSIIEEHPNGKEILEKYKGKTKEDIAKAAANAIAMKNDYLKGNQKAIEGITEKLLELPEDKLITELVNTQKQTGKTESDYKEVKPDNEVEVELPELPADDPKVQQIVEQQIVTRLKKKYKDFPDSLTSEDYLDFEREIRDEKGGLGERELLADIEKARGDVNEDLQKYLYAQSNLQNLYVETPVEVYNYLEEYNIGQLKNINDNSTKINDTTVKQEVEAIKQELGKYGLKPEDLKLDLSLETVDGALYNEQLYKLLFRDKDSKILDDDVVKSIGKVVLLKPGKLAAKFSNAYKTDIMTAYVDRKTSGEMTERQRLKGDALTTVTGSSQGQAIKDVTKVTNPDALKRIMEDIEAKY